jgi:spore coat polysaccharide biosynthesis predicted glycosyltransferase SpsG
MRTGWQIALRDELQQKRVEAVIQKHLKLVETTEQWLTDNQECEKVIFQEMNLPETSDQTMLANAELKQAHCETNTETLEGIYFRSKP